jgi:hypothetical protein
VTGRPAGHGDRHSPPGLANRFPGFDVVSQARHWDRVTADAVLARTGPQPPMKFFAGPAVACAAALLDLLTGQQDADGPAKVPVLEMVDARLAAGQTDGWRYADMPEDAQAWRDTLDYLDQDARVRCGTAFATAPWSDRMALLQAVLELKSESWHGLPAAHVWSLWTRYASTAFYSHPWAWAEIGFPGPAYPRGYKNVGVGKLEPFEVRDSQPSDDPAGGEGG